MKLERWVDLSPIEGFPTACMHLDFMMDLAGSQRTTL